MLIISKVLAQSRWTRLDSSIQNNERRILGDGAAGWWEVLDRVVDMAFILAGILAFIYLVYSGFMYLTAGGNPDATKKGQQGIVNAIIGLVIIFMAYGLVFFTVDFLYHRGDQVPQEAESSAPAAP